MLEKAETLQEQADNIKAELVHVEPFTDISFSDIGSLPNDRLVLNFS